jgi:hypothetical protein
MNGPCDTNGWPFDNDETCKTPEKWYVPSPSTTGSESPNQIVQVPSRANSCYSLSICFPELNSSSASVCLLRQDVRNTWHILLRCVLIPEAAAARKGWLLNAGQNTVTGRIQPPVTEPSKQTNQLLNKGSNVNLRSLYLNFSCYEIMIQNGVARINGAICRCTSATGFENQ